MKKKIIIISSSPRSDGNSEILCKEFAKGAVEAGHSVEIIYINKQNINYCTGCGTCFNNRGTCSQQDDMSAILNKMIASDVIVMATPVYFYTMCGQMKTFIDRTCAAYTEIKNKEFYFIVTAAVNSQKAMERTIEEFRGFTACLNKPLEKGIIYGIGAWNIGDILKTKAVAQAYETGSKI